jgi:hypothetical protein
MERIKPPAIKPGKQLTNVPGASSGNGPQRPGSTTPFSPDALTRGALVWESMRLIYGPIFQNTYGDGPNAVWLAAIAGLTDDECRAGFAKLAQELRKFPPNLTEFIAACRPRSAGVRFLGVPVTRAELQAQLEAQPARREVVEFHMARMRKLFAEQAGEK